MTNFISLQNESQIHFLLYNALRDALLSRFNDFDYDDHYI